MTLFDTRWQRKNVQTNVIVGIEITNGETMQASETRDWTTIKVPGTSAEFPFEPDSPCSFIQDKEAEIIGQDCFASSLGLDSKTVKPVSLGCRVPCNTLCLPVSIYTRNPRSKTRPQGGKRGLVIFLPFKGTRRSAPWKTTGVGRNFFFSPPFTDP